MNIPTLIIAAVIAVVFFAIVFLEVKRRRNGKGSCSCGCSGCSMSEVCHGENSK